MLGELAARAPMSGAIPAMMAVLSLLSYVQ